jgi:hypothetical protein
MKASRHRRLESLSDLRIGRRLVLLQTMNARVRITFGGDPIRRGIERTSSVSPSSFPSSDRRYLTAKEEGVLSASQTDGLRGSVP